MENNNTHKKIVNDNQETLVCEACGSHNLSIMTSFLNMTNMEIEYELFRCDDCHETTRDDHPELRRVTTK